MHLPLPVFAFEKGEDLDVKEVIEGRVKILEVVGRADVDDVGGGRHVMDGFDIQGLFSAPRLRVLLLAAFGVVVDAGCHDLRELVGMKCRQAAVDGPPIGILSNSGRSIRIDDRYRLAAAIIAGDAVGTLDLGGGVAARCVGKCAGPIGLVKPNSSPSILCSFIDDADRAFSRTRRAE